MLNRGHMAIIEMLVTQQFQMIQPNDATDPISQGAKSNPRGESGNNNLVINQTARSNYRIGKATSTLRLAQSILKRTSIKNLTISQQLSLYEKGARSETPHLTNILALWDTTRTVKFEPTTQSLQLTQSTTELTATPLSNTITFTQITTKVSIRNLLATNHYGPGSHANAYKLNRDFIATIQPTLGGPNGSPNYND